VLVPEVIAANPVAEAQDAAHVATASRSVRPVNRRSLTCILLAFFCHIASEKNASGASHAPGNGNERSP
jgi:hypothetical protein